MPSEDVTVINQDTKLRLNTTNLSEMVEPKVVDDYIMDEDKFSMDIQSNEEHNEGDHSRIEINTSNNHAMIFPGGGDFINDSIETAYN